MAQLDKFGADASSPDRPDIDTRQLLRQIENSDGSPQLLRDQDQIRYQRMLSQMATIKENVTELENDANEKISKAEGNRANADDPYGQPNNVIDQSDGAQSNDYSSQDEYSG